MKLACGLIALLFAGGLLRASVLIVNTPGYVAPAQMTVDGITGKGVDLAFNLPGVTYGLFGAPANVVIQISGTYENIYVDGTLLFSSAAVPLNMAQNFNSTADIVEGQNDIAVFTDGALVYIGADISYNPVSSLPAGATLEPGTWLMLACGAVLVGLRRRLILPSVWGIGEFG